MTAEISADLRERIENTIRFLAVDAVEQAQSGHPGAPMGLAPVAFQIWERLAFDPTDPRWPLRDRFVLSAGHASMLLYALLHLYGYDLPMDELVNFRQLGSMTPGHPEFGDTPGVEVTTGPLGQGFGVGVGMALAGRMTRARFGQDPDGPGHHRVYGIVSDGDLMEGISAEAGSLAGHLGLGNLIYVYDDNHITIDGRTDITFSENVKARFEAQGWHVEKARGNDHASVKAALDAAEGESARPSLVICRTTIGYGSPNKADSPKVHGSPLGADEARAAKQNLGWPTEPTFLIPDDVAAFFAERKGAKRSERLRRDARLGRWRDDNAELSSRWNAFRDRALPDGLAAILCAGVAGSDAATRKHSSTVIQAAADVAPYLVGGSADLAGSNLTSIEKGGDVGSRADGDPFAGRNIHYGIREHAMGAITNGLALDGTFLPFAGTFLIFSDYMRPAIRLAALMKQRAIYVFTHDSIFLGEDGPTHQPIEHLDALRAIPRLTLFRPADGTETALAWTWALERAEGPVAFALTRQGLPALQRPASFQDEDFTRGGYAVRETDADPDLVLVASGSEVALCVETAERLAGEGLSARVVSMPSLELFAAQHAGYRESLVPTGRVPVVAVEAARGASYAGLVGPAGLIVGIDRFGASAPAGALADYFGFTPDKLTARVLEHVRGGGAS